MRSSVNGACGGLSETVLPEMFRCLNTWSLVGGTFWVGLGGVALMEKVCYYGWSLRFQSHLPSQVPSLCFLCSSGCKPSACLLLQLPCLPPASPTPASPPPPSSGTISPNPIPCFGHCLVTVIEKKYRAQQDF